MPADKGQASPSEPARPPFALPGKATPKISELSPDDLRKRVEKAAEKRRRQKAARKKREEAKREQAAKYVVQPYGSDGAAIVTVNCPLWSTRMDLKTAFVRLVAEVTERMSVAQCAQQGRLLERCLGALWRQRLPGERARWHACRLRGSR